MDNIIKRLSTLLSVKSLVTLALTAVFAYMACTNQISQDFMTIYAVIIAFYFGTQSQKVQNVLDGEQLYLTENDCYKRGKYITPKGVTCLYVPD